MSKAYKAIEIAALAAGATTEQTLSVGSVDSLMVIWLITDSALVGDLGTTSVRPFTADETPVVVESPIPPVVVNAASKTGAVTSKVERFDVRGVDRVRLAVKNNAAAARRVQAHVYLDN